MGTPSEQGLQAILLGGRGPGTRTRVAAAAKPTKLRLSGIEHAIDSIAEDRLDGRLDPSFYVPMNITP